MRMSQDMSMIMLWNYAQETQEKLQRYILDMHFFLSTTFPYVRILPKKSKERVVRKDSPVNEWDNFMTLKNAWAPSINIKQRKMTEETHYSKP